MKFWRKTAAAALALAISLTAFASCGGNADNSKATGGETSSQTAGTSGTTDGENAGKLTYKGEITMYAQAYQPVEPTEAKPDPPTALRDAAEAYQKLHPDITINFITSVPGDDYDAWLKTKLSAGMAPDIVWAQNSNLTGGTYPKGAMIDIKPYMDESPNPYVEGNTKWGDLFYDNLLSQLYDTNGELWQINGDFVATAVVYNADMYKEAGIEKLPTNWTEFMDASEKLLDKGYIPWAFSFGNDADSMDRITWFSRLFYTNYYGEQFEEMAVLGSKTSLTPIEVAIAFKNGIYDVRDPKYLHFWQFLKEQTKYMPKDYMSTTQTPKAILNQFINKNIAMYFDGSWATNDMKLAKPDFEYGMYPFPIPEASSDTYATDISSKNSIGGPSAAFQFSIPSEKGNKTLNEEKLAACVDWLMFITTPENNAKIVNDLGSFIPTVKGAEALPGSEEILSSLADRSMMLEGGTAAFGITYLDPYYRTFQEYMSDKISLEQAAERLAPLAEAAVDKIISESDIDITQYLK